jgi:hypothetical protein
MTGARRCSCTVHRVRETSRLSAGRCKKVQLYCGMADVVTADVDLENCMTLLNARGLLDEMTKVHLHIYMYMYICIFIYLYIYT